MRKSRLVLLSAIVAFSFSVIGQQEPLPPIQPKTSADSASTVLDASDPTSEYPRQIIDLPVEPAVTLQTPTLEGAARNNDFATFDALFTAAEARGAASEFTALHDLWTYSVSDRVGAFYDQDMHDRLARAYSGYASYIEKYRIVDSRGHVFYPTSETKTFLLQQAVIGARPSAMIAQHLRATPSRKSEIPPIVVRPSRNGSQKAESAPAPLPEPVSAPVVAQASSATPAKTSPVIARPPRKRLQKAESTPTPAPLPEPVSAPVVVQASSEPPANVVRSEAAPTVAATPAPAPTPAPAVQSAPAVQAEAVTPQAPQQETPAAFNARAIIVAIMLFIGVGVLMVMLRASREERQHVLIPPTAVPQPPTAPTPQNDAKPITPTIAPAKPIDSIEKPIDNIEPIRKPSSRATGSRG